VQGVAAAVRGDAVPVTRKKDAIMERMVKN